MPSDIHLVALLGAFFSPMAIAHSRILGFAIGNVLYEGFDAKLPNNPEILAAWTTSVQDDGWVNFESYSHPNIICHRDATNAKGHVAIDAGSTIHVHWQGWPESHKGPILTYLAFCGDMLGACETVDKTELEFFLIDQHGVINPDGVPNEWTSAQGIWASDEFIELNSTWVVKIPETLRAGHYVMRQEWIALHYALDLELGGPQHYPQCVNLEIRGGGDEVPQGVKGMELYRNPAEEDGDPGLMFDISTSPLAEYVPPGPTLWESAVTDVEQTSLVVISTGSATPGEPEIIMEEREGANPEGRVMRKGVRWGVPAEPTP